MLIGHLCMTVLPANKCIFLTSRHGKSLKRKPEKEKVKAKEDEKTQRVLNFTSSDECACSPIDIVQNPAEQSDSDDSLCTVLDRLANKPDKYWEETGENVDEVESYRDNHPTIITDKERHIEVLVAGERQDTSGIIRVSTKEYLSRLHKREMKSSFLCKSLRDQVEALEIKIIEMKEEMIKHQKERNIAVGRVREFWRNKILEEGSRGGAILMAALRGQHSYK